MSKTGTFSITANIEGNVISSTKTVTSSGAFTTTVTLLAADAGTLSTRTSDTEGTATLTTGHGITTGNQVDLYWTGGARYNVTVGTVSSNSVPFSAGTGDNLPAEDSAISISKRTAITFGYSGDDVEAFMAQCNQACRFVFMDGSGEISGASFSVGANQGIAWYDGIGYANPVTGETLVKIEASTSASSNASFNFDALNDVSSED